SGVARRGPSVPCSRSPTKAVSADCSPAMYGNTRTSVKMPSTIAGLPFEPIAAFATNTGSSKPKIPIIATDRRSWRSARNSRRITTNVPGRTRKDLTSSRIARAPHDVYVRFLQRAVDFVHGDDVGACAYQTPDDLRIRCDGVFRAEV